MSSLHRVLGFAFGLAVLIGNAIGMGILRTPGSVAALVPSVPIFIGLWIAGATYALLGAMTIAELGAMRPRSGGQYPLVHDALGPFPGFVVGWTDWISTCGSVGAVALVLAEYLQPYMGVTRWQPWYTGSVVVVGIALLQSRGIKVGDTTQRITSLIKALALAGLAGAAIFLPYSSPATIADHAPILLPQGAALATAIIVGLQSIIFTYDGWTGPVYFGEETKNPGKEIPRAMISGVILVLVIYLTLNIGFLRVIPIGEMANDPLVAASVANRLFGPTGDTVLRVLVLVSLLASVNALQLMASRVPYAMSRDRLFPRLFEKVNTGGTPTPSLFTSTIIAILFMATGSVDRVLAWLAFFFVANYAMSFSSLFVLRVRRPDAERPFRVPAYPLVPGIALLGSIAFLLAQVWGDRDNSLIAIGLLILSLPAYLLLKSRQRAA